jgi:hypothetical protein
MGLTWALVWAPAAVLLGMIVDPDGSMDEMWVAIGAFPGFLGGVIFAAVLAMAGRRHRFDELSLSRFAAWGAVAGVLVGVLPFAAGGRGQWPLGLGVVGAITLLSAVSAAGSLALARVAERRDALAAGADQRRREARPRRGAGVAPRQTSSARQPDSSRRIVQP